MGKINTQPGQRLSLRCGTCRRPLGIFYQQKKVSQPPKLTILNGSLHRTKNNGLKIHIRCKCGAKTVFENQSPNITKKGWKRIK